MSHDSKPGLISELNAIRKLARWDGPDAAPKRMHEIWEKLGRMIENLEFVSGQTAPVSESRPDAQPEPVRIYAASRASVPERPAMWRSLRDGGVNIVSSWIDEAGPGETANLAELWTRIFAEIASADQLVLYVERYDFPLKGALIEVGIALGLGKPVLVVAPGLTFDAPSYRPIGSWIRHPKVQLVKDLKQACTKSVAQRVPDAQGGPSAEPDWKERAEAAENAILTDDLKLANALHINYCEDLVDEGTPWEVPVEPEPQYFESLHDAIVFLVNLPESPESERSLREQLSEEKSHGESK